MSSHHQPVMLTESLAGLNIKSSGIYVDATFGRGGHSQAILKQLSEHGQLIAFDQDQPAIDYAKKHFQDTRLTLIHSAFNQMYQQLSKRQLLGKIDGVLMDLGVSSPQLEDAQRGFSFYTDGPLDMRMNQTQGVSVATWLLSANEREIAEVLYQFGEERKSRQIAHAIKQYQHNQALETTQQLAKIITGVVKHEKNKHPATRSFQAMRIFINQELQQLTAALQQSIDLLAPTGRLCVISFHSVEDRLVKRFIRQNSQAKPLPKGLPIITNQATNTVFRNLGKSFPSEAELSRNRRCRSAILRVAERTSFRGA